MNSFQKMGLGSRELDSRFPIVGGEYLYFLFSKFSPSLREYYLRDRYQLVANNERC
jgi:hypothetical protein